MRKLTEHLYAETGFDWANVGAALTEAGVVLIDCPVRPSDSRKWQQEVRGLSPRGVRYLIATDYHGDHTTGAAFIEGGFTFIAPQRVWEEVARTEGQHPFQKQLFVNTLKDLGHAEEAQQIADAAVPRPQVCFEENLILHLPPLTFELRRLGGHSPACSVVYVPEEGVLFSGDVVIESPNPGMRDANLGEWLRALDWIEALPVRTIVPGHGEVCDKETVRKLKGRFGEIREAMEKLVRAGRTQAEAVADASLEKFFWADTSRGKFWVEERRETFRKGMETVYEEVKAALGA